MSGDSLNLLQIPTKSMLNISEIVATFSNSGTDSQLFTSAIKSKKFWK